MKNLDAWERVYVDRGKVRKINQWLFCNSSYIGEYGSGYESGFSNKKTPCRTQQSVLYSKIQRAEKELPRKFLFIPKR